MTYVGWYKNDLEVRLGAIYALGQLAKTSPEHHWPSLAQPPRRFGVKRP